MYSITLNFILKGLLLLSGLFGNLMMILVFSRKEFIKFPSRNIYIFLVIFNSITLIYFISNDLLVNFGIIWYNASEFSCKLYLYLRPTFASQYLLVFISIERFITIRFPKNKIIKKKKFQATVVFVLIACNLLVYHPILQKISYKNQTINASITNEIKCLDFSDEIRKIIGLSFIIYYAGLPFILMLIFSILLICTILKSRLRILRLNNQHDRNRLKKDIQFAISSIFMNVFYLALTLPFGVYPLISGDLLTNFYVNILMTLAYITLCDSFYILFCFNSVFRREVLILFRTRLRS